MYYNFKDYVYSILPKVPLDLIHTVIPLIKEDKINKLKHILLIYALIPKTSEEFLLK